MSGYIQPKKLKRFAGEGETRRTPPLSRMPHPLQQQRGYTPEEPASLEEERRKRKLFANAPKVEVAAEVNVVRDGQGRPVRDSGGKKVRTRLQSFGRS
jgi:hypothetical protein